MTVTEPLRAEHAELLPRLESLRDAAPALEDHDNEALPTVDTALAFLRDSLIPHAQAEDAVLYPVVEQVMKAPGATATMSRDHVEVSRLTADLQRLRDSLHGSSEAGLAPVDADEMFRAMHEHIHVSGSASHAPEHR